MLQITQILARPMKHISEGNQASKEGRRCRTNKERGFAAATFETSLRPDVGPPFPTFFTFSASLHAVSEN